MKRRLKEWIEFRYDSEPDPKNNCSRMDTSLTTLSLWCVLVGILSFLAAMSFGIHHMVVEKGKGVEIVGAGFLFLSLSMIFLTNTLEAVSWEFRKKYKEQVTNKTETV